MNWKKKVFNHSTRYCTVEILTWNPLNCRLHLNKNSFESIGNVAFREV